MKNAEWLRSGFSLIEMLVVVGIITVLIGASIGGYATMAKSADRTRCQELVSNVAVALTALYQNEGAWPKRLLRHGKEGGRLDAETAYALVANGRTYFSLTKNSDGNALGGHDRFGILTPWAQTVVKREGLSASESSKVGTKTVQDHVLYYALDLDGDGRIEGANVGGQSVDVRATAIVWCCGKDGEVDPYPYSSGSGKRTKTDDVYSWTPAQTRDVK